MAMGLSGTTRCVCVAVCLMYSGSFSQTPDQMKQKFSQFLGPDLWAKIVWQKQGVSSKPEPYIHGENSLMFVDTKVGEIKTYKNKGGYYTGASFTVDGQKIVYLDMTTREIRAMNSDGTGDKVIAGNYRQIGDTWQSSDGKQWVLGGRLTGGQGVSGGSCNYTTKIAIERIEIDNPGNVVLVATNDWPHFWEAIDCRTVDWIALSPDGKYLSGGFPRYDYVGIYDLVKDTLKKLPDNEQGCWSSVAWDGSNDVLYTDFTHTALWVVDVNLNQVLRKSVAGILPADRGSYESLRWTRNRDYCTFAALSSGGNYNHPNPLLVRISDLSYVAVADAYQYAQGDADVFFYGSGATGSDRMGGAPVLARKPAAGASARIFDCRGRITGAGTPRRSGAFVRSSWAGSSELDVLPLIRDQCGD